MALKDGDVVYIEYVGHLETGEIFDLTDEALAKKEGIFNPKGRYGPVPIVIGEGFVIKGLDEALKEMSVGEEREIDIPPEKAFGKRDPKLVKLVTISWLKQRDIPPTPGLAIDFGNLKGRIQSVSGGRARIDFNNPLAGKTLHYKVKVVKKVERNENKIAAIAEFFTGEKPKVSIKKGEAEVETRAPPELRNAISKIVLKTTNVKKLKFVETFQK